MTEHSEYKTRPDGSIDTAHYMARGREMRSAAFFAALGKLRRPVAAKAQAPVRQRPARAPAAIQPAHG